MNTDWTRHLVHRAERTRTTWTFRLGVLGLVVATLWATSALWTRAVARSLTVDATVARSDAILVENFDPDYLLFERARQLRKEGLAGRVLVPVHTDPGTTEPNVVAVGMAELMARIARAGVVEIVPTRQVEPITLETARDLRGYLERQRIRSVIVVTPLFRSRRAALVYGTTFGRAGITVRYAPVKESRGVDDWTRSWHGIQEVVEQWLKLQYYRLYVMPFLDTAGN